MSAGSSGRQVWVVLLRGINLGAVNRVSMAALRGALVEVGYGGARTHLQSGNILLTGDTNEEGLSTQVERLLATRFGVAAPAVCRKATDLARVVADNPLAELALTDPKRFQVTFLRDAPDDELAADLAAVTAPAERVAVLGREIFAWHPDGIARSRLWARLGASGGVGGTTATSRNWSTVTALHERAINVR